MVSQATRDGPRLLLQLSPSPCLATVALGGPSNVALATWKLLPHAVVLCLDPSSFSALCLMIPLVPEISVSQTRVSFSVTRRVRQKPAGSRVGGSWWGQVGGVLRLCPADKLLRTTVTSLGLHVTSSRSLP